MDVARLEGVGVPKTFDVIRLKAIHKKHESHESHEQNGRAKSGSGKSERISVEASEVVIAATVAAEVAPGETVRQSIVAD